MYKFLFFLFFTVSISTCRAQVVIGSSNVTPAAMLKLDSNVKALRIPVFSITSSTDALAPVPSPANGLMIYNTNSAISDGIGRALAYWGSNGGYHFQGSAAIADNIVDKDRIPILVFSAKIGQKPLVVGSYQTLTITNSEILIDTHFGWNANGYVFPKNGIYTVETVVELSKTSTNNTEATFRIQHSGTTIANSTVQIIGTLNRGFVPVSVTRSFNSNTNLTFSYRFDVGAGNYRVESGTINIYRH